ncbi:MAG: hypothetical protein HYY59_05605 [Candidatus Omnitrophica bacterium]|nr:hypothetical protein [Candidatus Omnitrophota bacterium]
MRREVDQVNLDAAHSGTPPSSSEFLLMGFSLETFARAAERATRNPLGVIGLFIVLIYGCAGLVLGSAGGTLDMAQRWAMVAFIVLFPCLVLLVFYRLVTKYPSKLYAPSDWRDETNFFRSQTTEEQKQRLEKEVSLESKDVGSARRADEDIRAKYLLAEDLALRVLESELKAKISRQVVLKDRHDLAFDGAIGTEHELLLIEVKYTSTSFIPSEIIAALHKRASTLAESLGVHSLGRAVNLLIVIVADMNEDDRLLLENSLSRHDRYQYQGVELRVYDFRALRRQFGV